MGMKRKNSLPTCPKCGTTGANKVKNTYFTKHQEILRHRECTCGWKFWSYQEIEVVLDPAIFAIKIPRWGSAEGAKKRIELVPLN
jgi:hypothetical protein